MDVYIWYQEVNFVSIVKLLTIDMVFNDLFGMFWYIHSILDLTRINSHLNDVF